MKGNFAEGTGLNPYDAKALMIRSKTLTSKSDPGYGGDYQSTDEKELGSKYIASVVRAALSLSS